MTAVLADAVDRIVFPKADGLSQRTLSEVLARMAKIARTDGTFKHGLRASRIADMTKYSLRTVRRAIQWLTEHGYLEKLAIGGGRASTKFRIMLDKLAGHLPKPLSSHASSDPVARDQRPHGTPLSGSLDVPRLHKPWSRRDAPWRQAAPHFPPPIEEVCEQHGSTAGILPSGEPRCPGCRRTLAALHPSAPTTEVRR